MLSQTPIAALRGVAVLQDPRSNHSTAFSYEDRERLCLTGFLPEAVETIDRKLERVLQQIDGKPNDLERYVFLMSLQGCDETLFYRTIMSDPARFMPLVYTPTVGEACQKFDHVFRRHRGLYLACTRKDDLEKILRNWPERDVRFIVVTDGERILGLGDLGVGGMGIPIGKLALYTACAGVPPQMTLPIMLDVGTNSDALLEDPLYLGLRQKRIPRPEYEEFIGAFVAAVETVFPLACIQFEDFAFANAAPILARFRDKACCFNDDIQGTAAVALAGLIAALKITGGALGDQRFLFFGAGSAGGGIANMLVEAMKVDGMSEGEARKRCWLYDVKGLIQSARTGLADFQQPFAHQHAVITDFHEAIETLKPTALIGCSTVGKAFDRKVIKAMARINERPIIFPYSNPTSHAECSAQEAYEWSDGRAIFASGSPFQPVHLGDKTFVPGQGNNVYIFPAMGMAIYATQAKRVTDSMFIVAAKALADQVTKSNLAVGLIYPPQHDILKVSLKVAAAIASHIFEAGLARVAEPHDVESFVAQKAYTPIYADRR